MTEQDIYFDDSIDLRRWLRVLWQYRNWIVALTFGAALVALLISLALPPTYEATALAVITSPQYKLQFDPRIETVINPVDMQIDVYVGLATSDSMVQQNFSQLDPLPTGVENVTDLRDMLDVSGKNGLLTFSVKAKTPQDASRIANMWVQTFVKEANRVYGTNDSEQLAFFQEQLQAAATRLQQAETAMTEFVARDRSAIVQNQLASLQAGQEDYLRAQRSLSTALDDVDALLQKMQKQTGAVDFSDQMNALFLSLRVFNGGQGFPLQLQLSDPANLNTASPTEQRQQLEEIHTVIEKRLQEITSQMNALEPQILSLQTEQEGYQLEKDRLERELSLSRDMYTALAHKVDEVSIVTNNSVGQVRIASTAMTPLKPVSPRKLVNTVLAAMVGAMLAVGGAFAVEWWREEEPQTTASKPISAD